MSITELTDASLFGAYWLAFGALCGQVLTRVDAEWQIRRWPPVMLSWH